ncbi:MAG: hypothetical protein JNL48_02820 [Acidobacteria bacterium]|jgi:hypothetical protein|nr:hypothetical protein [Acidobacteriota bacterium]
MRVSTVNHRIAALLLAASALVTTACGEVARTGRSPAYLQLVRLEGASGAEPDEFGGTLLSDVVTIVEVKRGEESFFTPTIFNDLGRAEFRVGLKDPGPVAAPTTPSPLNAITLTRYRVVYKRGDGRNTQGVDVPYAFDGGMTVTVPATGTAIGIFDIVRNAAKAEAPLLALAGNGGAQIINTIADVTFWGKDQAGNDVTVTGSMTITFANFGDPE